MADVFLSYAREDGDRARWFVAALEAHELSVWWDLRIPHGKDFTAYLQAQLDEALCIVVLWSRVSVASQFVRDEAAEGLNGRLVPALVDPVRQPLGFRQIQAADLSKWDGRSADSELERLIKSITDIVQAARSIRRDESTSSMSQTDQPNQATPTIVKTIDLNPSAGTNGGGIFLSYAAEDLPAAVRIRDTLQRAGLEIWSDAPGEWNDIETTKTRISSSYLFIAIISEHSLTAEARVFRVQWREAEQHTKMLPESARYVLPVVIDATSPMDGRIPNFLRALHWTTAPDGTLPPEFVANARSMYREMILRTRSG